MRLTELDPRWLTTNDKRIGFIFHCPKRPKWWMTCFAYPTPHEQQDVAVKAVVGETFNWQPCAEACGWIVAGGIDSAQFETITVTPSLDGGQSMWHGFITSGEIVGGL